MSSTTGNEIFTERVAAGARHYFFDVKKTSGGELYLVISESRKSGEGFKHSRVMVFEEHLESFIDGMRKAIVFCRKAIGVGKGVEENKVNSK